MPSASVDAGTRHCRASGQAGTLPITSASPVRRNGGTWPRATPSEARVAQSAIAPSASSVALTAARRRLSARTATPARSRRRSATARTGLAPRSSRDDQSNGCSPWPRRARASSSMPAAHSRRRGRSAFDGAQAALDDLRRRLLGIRLQQRRELLDRGVGLAQARDGERRAALGAAHRLARRQGGAAGGALHRLLLRLRPRAPRWHRSWPPDRAPSPAGRRRAGSAPRCSTGSARRPCRSPRRS